MYSELINQLTGNFDDKLLRLALHIILVGAVGMGIKDLTTKVYQFISLKLSDFGRGTRIEVGGKTGQIIKIGFSEVEIELDDGGTFLIPVSSFSKSNKTILHHKKGSRRRA